MSNLADSMPFSAHLGVEVTSAAKDAVRGVLEIKPEFCTVGRAVHGGALMAFADSLAAIGAFLNLPEGAKGTTTIESKTNFLGPAREGDTLIASARPVKVGKRLSVWQTDITDADGRAIALVTQTQMVL